MEKLIYELRPYLYLLLSAWSIYVVGGLTWASFFSGVLLASSFWVFHMRMAYRNAQHLKELAAPVARPHGSSDVALHQGTRAAS